ncbi:DUF3035 domain-containing protein [Pseudooceanicola sp.]|uniref:DUF3035 domain-containing protein n=1 Tax=Pseudooceanicola sp. TaxID=1914328 RepID=UPI00260B5555|nr:DUF3035 domain-containing protein [Pseudooceanicola sp.]MDF1856675.1 DUF3035 domain-containing protein [Pseudooceanicola sp.]
MKPLRLLILLCLPALAACSGSDRERDISMRSFQNVGGPEEFAILPSRPLEKPTSYASLPEPTPGGGNRADLTPKKDAVAALGGRASALDPSGVPSSEGALVNYASRQGRDPAIRATLAKEDEDFRSRQSRFTKIRLFKVDRYYHAYRREILDPQTIANRYRRAGAPTPTAPPRER